LLIGVEREKTVILCCGEALIDFLPGETAEGSLTFQPFNGGSIYNVAIALGRLGKRVGFFGGLSSDFFGDMLVCELENSKVSISHVVRSARATTLAFVRLVNGQAEYAFVDEGSAGRMLGNEQLPQLTKAVSLLHFGSISLIHDPAASSFEQLMLREKESRIISIDPNIRPGLIADISSYRARLLRMIAMADIVKISDEDLEWLAPKVSVEDMAGQWLRAGAALVVVTKGAKGGIAFARGFQTTQLAKRVDVVDTVGAGDTFMAGLLASLDDQGLLEKNALLELEQAKIASALEFAGRAAAITVSRAGANPPWIDELS
jgi:fructokinase